MRPALLAVLSLSLAASLPAAKPLDIYFIDTEGGQATLVVTPSGQSMLIDTGWPGRNNRDANRIGVVAKKAGVKAIDYVVITHFHDDHVGGAAQLVDKLPVKTFVDHGDNRETGTNADKLNGIYTSAVKTAKRLTVKPGDKLPLKGVEVTVLSADGNVLPAPAGASANSLCEAAQKRDDDPSENARSLGTLLQFGKFRFIDLGDLTWNKELDLVCPTNRVGKVDVYLTTHHGMNISGPPAIVHALHPRVAIMNNGAKKGGTPEAWKVVRSSPGLEDLWQIHFALAGGKETNTADSFIANIDENCEGNYLKLSAMEDGSFTVMNPRNKYEKRYPAQATATK